MVVPPCPAEKPPAPSPHGFTNRAAVASAVAGDAAAVALGLAEGVPGEESGRMRIAADPAHLVAAHAIRGISLVVAGGAVLDVAPRGVPVERARAGQAPARGMGIDRAR